VRAAVLLLVCCAAVGCAALPSTGDDVDSTREKAVCTWVSDGDTIRVELNGERVVVRYIGVNSPEVDQPFGSEATAANRRLVEGRSVLLERDVSETDRYGRLLRYVYLADGTFVNAEMVRIGLAEARAYPPDTGRQAELARAQREARAAGVGIWAVQDGAAPSLTSVPNAVTLPTAPPSQSLRPIIRIVAVDVRAEVVTLDNAGGQPQDLAGWVLVSERGNQACELSGELRPGERLEVWARGIDADKGGFNCGFPSNIWSDVEPDAAVLYDASGTEVGRR